MCVALPGKVIEVHARDAVVDFNGNKVTARTGLLPVKEGDNVLVHAGCILQKLSDADAKDMTDLFKELASFGQAQPMTVNGVDVSLALNEA